MNNKPLIFILGLALGGGATWLLLHRNDGGSVSKPAAAASKAEEKPNPLRLSAARREQAGITVVKPVVQTVAPEVQAFGRVLDPAALATGAAEVEAARGALTASEQELDRATKLFAAGGATSAQAVETARANATRDRAAFNSAQARMGAAWGPQVARNAAAILDALAQGGALVRLDLLPGEEPGKDAREARITWGGQGTVTSAEILGPAPTSDPQVQGMSFLALIRGGALPGGMALRATIPGRGAAAEALVVPRSAIVYHQGSAWLFVLGEEDTFERKLVTLGRSVGADAVAIASGVEAGDQVAAAGAQQLLAAELQAGGAAEEP